MSLFQNLNIAIDDTITFKHKVYSVGSMVSITWNPNNLTAVIRWIHGDSVLLRCKTQKIFEDLVWDYNEAFEFMLREQEAKGWMN